MKKKNKRRNNSTGFTLVELIVTIAILGIITMMALPGVKKIQETNSQRKFEEYAKTMITSAKLYQDAYTEDMFGNHESGCIKVSLDELTKKNLAKDIKINRTTCINPKTYVKVTKAGDIYYYEPSVYCTENGSKAYDDSLTGDENSCKLEDDDDGPTIKISPESKNWFNRSAAESINDSKPSTKGKIKITVSDSSGLTEGQKLKYVWRRMDKGMPSESSYKELFYSNQASTADEPIQSKSLYIDLPEKYDGVYKLYVIPVNIKDLMGNTLSSNVISVGGEFKLDDKKPTCGTFAPQNTNWTQKSQTITMSCSDDKYTGGGATSGCKDSYSKTYGGSNTYKTQSLSFEVSDNANNKITCTNTVNIYYDGQNPQAPTKGTIGQVSGSNTTATIGEASGATDKSDSKLTILYCLKKNTDTKPNNTDGCFTTSRTYTRTCGTKYHAWAIAEDAAGNRSAVYDMGSTSDGENKYSGWGSCSKSCGTGSQSRTNSCKLVTTGFTQNCNTRACCSSVKDSGSWYNSGSCSKPCGTGSQRQLMKQVSTYDNADCGTRERYVDCNTQSCCANTYNDPQPWGNWGSCSKSCGTGSQTRTRVIIRRSAYSGAECSRYTDSTSQNCNTQDCCSSYWDSYGGWGGWGGCSRSCGGGIQYRYRTVTRISSYNGQSCGTWTDTGAQGCNTGSCAPHIVCWRDGALGAYRSDNGYYQSPWDYTLYGYTSGNAGGSGNYRTGYGELIQQDSFQWYWRRYTWISQGANGRDPGTGYVSNWCGM